MKESTLPKEISSLDVMPGTTGSTFYKLAEKDGIKVGVRMIVSGSQGIVFKGRIEFDDPISERNTGEVLSQVEKAFPSFKLVNVLSHRGYHMSVLLYAWPVHPGEESPEDTFKNMEAKGGLDELKSALKPLEGSKIKNMDKMCTTFYNAFRDKSINEYKHQRKQYLISKANSMGVKAPKFDDKGNITDVGDLGDMPGVKVEVEKGKKATPKKEEKKSENGQDNEGNGSVVQFPGANQFEDKKE